MSVPTRGMLYWPVARDNRDWPKGTSEALKAWITEQVTVVLRMHEPSPLWVIIDRITHEARNSACDAAREWREGALLDWRYALVERALRAIDAEPRYHPQSE